MINNMFEMVDYAIKTKRFVGGLGRLKKDGSIKKINGQVFKRSTTKNGDQVILIDNFFGKPRKGTNKRWQFVLMNNLVAFNENKWKHTKAA